MGMVTNEGFAAELKRILTRVLGQGSPDPSKERTFEILFRLLGHMTRLDGRVTTEETALVRAIMIECELPSDWRERAMTAYAGNGARPLDLGAELEPYLEVFPQGSQEHTVLLENLLLLARADGRVDAKERGFLAELADGLGFPAATVERKLQGLRNPSLH